MKSSWIWSASIVALLCGGARADEPVRTLTFKQAIDLALAQNPDAALAKNAIETAEDHTRGIKAKRLPDLRLDAVGNMFSKPYELPFGTEVFTLHERFTSISSVTVTQQLTGLAYLSELIGAAEHETAAKQHEYDRVRLDIAYRTADAYLRLLEARASAEVAKQSLADIQSGLDRAVQLRGADVYTDIDVLRFKSAKAAAVQAAIKSQSAAETATAELVLQLGLHDASAIEIGDDLPPAPPPLALALPAAQDRALATRPELAAARERVAAADDTRRGAKLLYLPDIHAVGVAQYNTGVEPFQPKHEEYVGLRMSWDLWNWGGTKSRIAEAEHGQKKARLDASSLADQVRLDVRRRWLAAKTSYDSLAAAQSGQEAAEEAFRLQKVKLDAAAATTTDVLDAETDVARARLAFSLARYDYYLALVGLARAIGDVPDPTH